MSGVATAIVAAAVISASVGVYAADRNRKATNQAADQAKKNALAQEKAADEANNRANRQSPDISAILAAAQRAGKNGVGGTMLTGAQGIDPNALKLGKTSLLGS